MPEFNEAFSYSELGLTGIRQTDGVIEEEFLHDLQGLRGVKIFKEMALNEPIIGGILHATVQLMRKVKWSVYSSVDDNKHNKMKEFGSSCFNDMSFSWPDTVGEILSMLTYGWSLFEIVYKIRRGESRNPKFDSMYDDGKIGWRKFAIRSQDSLSKWKIDTTGGIQGMYQDRTWDSAFTGEDIFLPISKCLLFRTILQKNNPEGLSVLRVPYKSYFYKKNIEEIMVTGIERDLVGLPTMQPNETFKPITEEDKALVSSIKRVLRNIRRDEQEGLLIPPGWVFNLVGSPGEKQFDVVNVISYYDKRIAIAMLGQFILLGMERVGSFALSKDQSNLHTLSLYGWLGSIAEVINRFALFPLYKLNGWTGIKDPPYFSHGRIEEYSLDELSVFITRISKAGLLLPDEQLENLLRSIAGLTEMPERSSVVREAGMKKITHTATEDKRMQIANGKNIKDEPDRGGDVDEKAEGYFVYVENDIHETTPSFLTAHNLAQVLKAKYRDQVVGISQILGKSGEETVCESLITYIPMSTIDKNDTNYMSWARERLATMSGNKE